MLSRSPLRLPALAALLASAAAMGCAAPADEATDKSSDAVTTGTRWTSPMVVSVA